MYTTPGRHIAILVLLVFTLTACASSPPRNVANSCAIFEERKSWYKAAKASEQRWGVPIAVNLAFIYQESSFQARVKPDRTRILWILPGPRPSTAYGFAQALDSTWSEYQRETGNRRASRANFADAIDFVAWYNSQSARQSRINSNNARDLYFAYHEGNAGFQRGSHRSKEWLLQAANRVQANASQFGLQLDSCRRELDKTWWQRLLS